MVQVTHAAVTSSLSFFLFFVVVFRYIHLWQDKSTNKSNLAMHSLEGNAQLTSTYQQKTNWGNSDGWPCQRRAVRSDNIFCSSIPSPTAQRYGHWERSAASLCLPVCFLSVRTKICMMMRPQYCGWLWLVNCILIFFLRGDGRTDRQFHFWS